MGLVKRKTGCEICHKKMTEVLTGKKSSGGFALMAPGSIEEPGCDSSLSGV